MENKHFIFSISLAAAHIMNSSSSSDDEVVKISNYVEEIVPRMTDKQFQSNFRMSRTSFEALIGMAERINELHPMPLNGLEKISLTKELLIMTWYLANLESLRSVAERFGISKSNCWNALYRACFLIQKINQTYGIIKWPNAERQAHIAQGFSRNNFVGVIGCIDGSYIRINRPKLNGNSYVNRKGYHSIILQGICDHKKLFIDIYAGEAGSLHDYTVFKRSEIFKQLRTGQAALYGNNYLLGDKAYKLSPTVMVAFKNNGYLTHSQKQFNKQLNKIRYNEQSDTENAVSDVSSDEEEDEDIMHEDMNTAIARRNQIMENL
ncbi:uncharacterized protein [Prorops nasuta]|uniref:uncharacterized protein n=1 Tax=Prorops nasuta TaxID=863751 RepID=UPI0034CDE6CF